MRKQVVRNKRFLLVGLLCFNIAVGQQQYKAALPAITQSGYYRIVLSPDVTAKAKLDLADIRIEDNVGTTVPYILKKESPLINEKELKPFIQRSVGLTTDSNTQVVMDIGAAVQALGQTDDYSLVLIMQRANAYRETAVSGSDDLQNWYAVADRVVLDAGGGNSSPEQLQVLSVPLAKYKYLRLVMKDKGLQPIKLLKAGVLLNKSIHGQYQQVGTAQLRKKDSSDRRSYIELQFDGKYPVAKLVLNVKQPVLYKRNVSVFDTTMGRSVLIGQVVLQPGMDSIDIDNFKNNNMLLVVDNFDNPPLELNEVKGYQLRQYVIANLETGKEYFMLMGDEKARTPIYDLTYFANSITIMPEELTSGQPVRLSSVGQPVAVAKKGLPAVWLWTIIIVALAGLLGLSRKLIRDISQNKKP